MHAKNTLQTALTGYLVAAIRKAKERYHWPEIDAVLSDALRVYYSAPNVAEIKLHAAAPELLKALQDLVAEIRAYSSPECDDEGAPGAAVLKAADAAIAKATQPHS